MLLSSSDYSASIQEFQKSKIVILATLWFTNHLQVTYFLYKHLVKLAKTKKKNREKMSINRAPKSGFAAEAQRKVSTGIYDLFSYTSIYSLQHWPNLRVENQKLVPSSASSKDQVEILHFNFVYIQRTFLYKYTKKKWEKKIWIKIEFCISLYFYTSIY